MTLLDFEVEKMPEDGNDKIQTAYILKKNGVPKYHLIRNVPNPNMLFVIYHDKMGVAKVKGHSWFTDIDGTLKAV